VLDPWDISYYSLPFLLTLLTWEGLSYTRPPVLTVAASFAAWLIFRETSSEALNLSLDAQALVFAIVSVPAIAALAATLYAPGIRQLLAPRGGHELFGWAHAPTRPRRMRRGGRRACAPAFPTRPADSAPAPTE
jgi:hypothetical protein